MNVGASDEVSTTSEISTGTDGALVNVRWVMPEGFFELPTEADSIEDLADQLIELAKEIIPKGTADMQYQWAAMCIATYDELVETGVQYAGFVITEVDGTRCTANVNLSLVDLAEEARLSPVQSTVKALRALGHGDVDEILLPCGPAVSWVGTRQAVIEAALAPSGRDEPFWTSFINVQVPLFNGTAVVLEMTTPTQEGWDVFSSMFAGVAKSLTLFDPVGNPMDTHGRLLEIDG
ncbi:hypothetical protein DEJ49_21355 [Streptomyces venezuelae]|uniref:Uncharacterized protein n=1 Tax=Streptomyces venezuelae TaxID=54571 RepID=A0A5P2CK08_STRVZ|nr:hypothetical protein [Streptomyces venezuelae]QES43192.1 hypothetical protein DEJ49_21355 [Streptomyces venezuelae]